MVKHSIRKQGHQKAVASAVVGRDFFGCPQRQRENISRMLGGVIRHSPKYKGRSGHYGRIVEFLFECAPKPKHTPAEWVTVYQCSNVMACTHESDLGRAKLASRSNRLKT